MRYRGKLAMSNDLTYSFRKEEIQKNGIAYYKKRLGRREKVFMTPYEYGSIKNEFKKRGVKK